MSHVTVASIQCPACGGEFLCQQNEPQAVVSCPLCAQQNYRAQFPTRHQAAALQTVKRRVWQQPADDASTAADALCCGTYSSACARFCTSSTAAEPGSVAAADADEHAAGSAAADDA
jgi:hypothetical protein